LIASRSSGAAPGEQSCYFSVPRAALSRDQPLPPVSRSLFTAMKGQSHDHEQCEKQKMVLMILLLTAVTLLFTAVLTFTYFKKQFLNLPDKPVS
jgi:hypothetical protein